jgi:hypothetical protein
MNANMTFNELKSMSKEDRIKVFNNLANVFPSIKDKSVPDFVAVSELYEVSITDMLNLYDETFERENTVIVKPKRKYNRKEKVYSDEIVHNPTDIKIDNKIETKKEIVNTKQDIVNQIAFKSQLQGNNKGSKIQERLQNITNSIIKDNLYHIEFTIEEL